jgi:hypothetical protein
MQIRRHLFRQSFVGLYAARVLKGALLLLSLIVPMVGYEMTCFEVITVILLTFSCLISIDWYCQTIGDQIRQGARLSPIAVLNALGDQLPQGIPVLPALVLFGLAAANVITESQAFRLTEIICVMLLGLFGYASNRLAKKTRVRSLLAALLAISLGLLLVRLRVWVTS